MGKRKTRHHKKANKLFNKDSQRKESVLLVSDSHGRQLLNLFNKYSNFDVKCVISPGATFEYVFSLLQLNFETKFKTVVILAGTNDVDDCGFINHSFFDTHQKLLRFCDNNRSVNVIVATIPKRKDRVRFAVRLSNDRLNAGLYNSFGLYSVFDVGNYGRHLFTGQGLHLNSAGKLELVAGLINAISVLNNLNYQCFLMNKTVSSRRMRRD
jgi:hypothetical protein